MIWERNRVKGTHESSVNTTNVEPVEAPVITSGVALPRVAPVASTIVEIVEQAFDTHAPGLKAFARAAVRDDDDADDLVQETFLRFVRSIQHDDVPDNVGGWLHRVCANLVISRSRRRVVAERSKAILATDDVGASPEEHAVRGDDGARIRQGLMALPTDARVALLMAAAGYSVGEISLAIGRTMSATSTYICRARAHLREVMATGTAGTR